MTLKDEIERCLGSEVTSNPKLLAECQKICEIYNITPTDLQFKWEAATWDSRSFAPAREAVRFTSESLVRVRDQIKKELEGGGSAKKKAQSRGLASGVASVNRNKMPLSLNRNIKATQRVPEPQVKMEPDMFTISDISIDSKGPNIAGPSRVTFKGPKNDVESRKKRSYRYMFENPGERGQVLDSQIEEIAELVQQHYGIEELGDPVDSTVEDVFVVGRITHELSETPKLTEATLTLETSRRLSNPDNHYRKRIAIKFDPGLKIKGGAQGAGALGLFPGAIVAFKGQNGGADWFLVNEILALPPLLSSPSMKPSPDDDSFSMYVASGPFTPETDLKYAAWNSFVQTVKQAKPAVLVLIGPFVDVSHPFIQEGDVDESPLEMFQRIFLEPLRDILNSSPGSIAVLIPSVRDMITSHAVYPQSEFQRLISKSDSRIRLLPNPCTFSVNDITFGATSVDVLFHLRKEEVVKRGQEVESVVPVFPEDTGTDPFGNACRHLLQQRSFYPVFPVPYDLRGEVNLDVTHSAGLKLDGEVEDVAPDVLILPSRYRQFCKIVHTTMAVNPSTLAKGVYSTIDVSSSAPGKTLKERLKVEVVKLEE
ncbi:DNA polymerase alpha/epsilon subunit B-domain-containing protein [Rhodocollybia butyracea]|uniref:DNA polymerase alpha subunit B n=1 Tax=Rhodocollybia butyracea TaxID=206335 RepID=A0A9P5Q8U1_9AGAR|nr:DNA polymerase alpha/epsilon subunit B-domain-containing protein [Rhodocollybia butyracea]